MSSSLITACYYCVSDQPCIPQAFQNISTQYHNSNNSTTIQNFNVKLCVRFVQRCPYCFDHHTINIPSPLSSHYISCTEFFSSGGSSFLYSNLSHHLIDHEVLDSLIPNIILVARWLFINDPPRPSVFQDRFIVFPLAVDVVFELDENVNLEDVEDDDDEIRMIPTCEEVIESLSKVKIQEDDADDSDDEKINECCICLEEFCGKEEVSKMPCEHVFHCSCIVRWLKTSHLCPLCRYPMPVDNNS